MSLLHFIYALWLCEKKINEKLYEMENEKKMIKSKSSWKTN